MKNFKIIEVEELKNKEKYAFIENNIFQSLKSFDYRLALSMTLENGENDQYPLEDILDKFLVHIEIFLDSKEEKELRYVFGGDLENLKELQSIIGKRIYNQSFIDVDGKERVKLIIE